MGLAAQGQGEEGSGSRTEVWFRNEAATWKAGDPQEKEVECDYPGLPGDLAGLGDASGCVRGWPVSGARRKAAGTVL